MNPHYVECCNVNFLKSSYLEIRLNIIRRATYPHAPSERGALGVWGDRRLRRQQTASAAGAVNSVQGRPVSTVDTRAVAVYRPYGISCRARFLPYVSAESR